MCEESMKQAFLRGGLVLCTALLSCAPSAQTLAREADSLRADAAGNLTTGAQCTSVRLSTEPDLLGWDPGARAKLVSIVDQGLAVVRYEQSGCDVALTVLGDCLSRKARYEYRAYLETQRKVAEDERSLYASFPIAVARLRASIAQGRGIRADYRMAGVQRIPIGTEFAANDLMGRCEGATHVVSAVYRGVFAVGAATRDVLQADASLLGGRLSSRIDVLDRAGDPAACGLGGDLTPGCDVPLRLELTPIKDPAEAGKAAGAVAVDRTLPAAERVTDGRNCPPHMAAIPPGTFFMGANVKTQRDGSIHRVTLSPYCLDLNEVTVGEYENCVKTGVCVAIETDTRFTKECLKPYPHDLDRPRNCVAWEQARRYCEWAGKRLPTEAEWEYAARGGQRNLLFPWGNDRATPEHACWNRREDKRPCRVGQFPAGSFGLKDMAGNVQEWVWDWFGAHSPQPAIDPVGPAFGSRHVTKGGGYWDQNPRGLLAWGRNDEAIARAYVGFRCARDR
jgi:formylglycine-generating enzyme required for sulfatase activity